MAFYKGYDRAKFAQSPVFALWFRRYAPFDAFGGGTGFEFEGDHRKGASTSPKATSRTYGCIFFNRNEVLYGFSGSSGSRWLGYSSLAKYGPTLPIAMIGVGIHRSSEGNVVGMANVSLKVVEQNHPNIIAFTASTSGAMPLLPGTPNIDTTVTAQFNYSSPQILMVRGNAHGDDFPNLEVFLDSGSGHTALLIDGRTAGSRNFGPVARLWGSGSNQLIGSFSGALVLNEKGALAFDYAVSATDMDPFSLSSPNPVKLKG